MVPTAVPEVHVQTAASAVLASAMVLASAPILLGAWLRLPAADHGARADHVHVPDVDVLQLVLLLVLDTAHHWIA